jgi:hypothetical protein
MYEASRFVDDKCKLDSLDIASRVEQVAEDVRVRSVPACISGVLLSPHVQRSMRGIFA